MILARTPEVPGGNAPEEVAAPLDPKVVPLGPRTMPYPSPPQAESFPPFANYMLDNFRAGLFIKPGDWERTRAVLDGLPLAELRRYKRALLADHPWAQLVAKDVALKDPKEGDRRLAQLEKIHRILSGAIFDGISEPDRIEHNLKRSIDQGRSELTAVTPARLNWHLRAFDGVRAAFDAFRADPSHDPKRQLRLLHLGRRLEDWGHQLAQLEAPLEVGLAPIRAEIQATGAAPQALLDHDRLDDAWFERLLGVHRGSTAGYDGDNVGYGPTPAKVIFDLAQGAGLGPNDVLYDCGAGLGKVALLMALLTGCKVVAIERHVGSAEALKKSVRALGLAARIEVRVGDAQAQDYAQGDAFYFFNPFRGEVMKEVSRRIRAVAAERPVKILSFGPTDLSAFFDYARRPIGMATLWVPPQVQKGTAAL